MRILILSILLMSTTWCFAEEVALSVSETQEPDGKTRYDFKSGSNIYHFWSKDQIEIFANSIDGRDAVDERHIKEILKSEINSDGVDRVVEEMKQAKKTFEITETKSIQEKPSEKIINP